MLLNFTAGDFKAPAIGSQGDMQYEFRLSHYLKGSDFGVLFFYPMNFSYVCPTELIALERLQPQLKKRNAKVVAISTDTHLSHQAYRQWLSERYRVPPLSFPMVADMTKEICRNYQTLLNDAYAARITYIVDAALSIRGIMATDLNIGRSTTELLRQIDALKHHTQTSEVCPADWQIGQSGIALDAVALDQYLAKIGQTPSPKAA